MMNDPAGDDRILRAKYLDWCSAKVADRFLELTPDQIYELAHEGSGAAPGIGEQVSNSAPLTEMVSLLAAGGTLTPAVLPSSAESGNDGGAAYLSLVRRVAESLFITLRLPTFEEWAQAYRESPATFDEELLGLWQSDAP